MVDIGELMFLIVTTILQVPPLALDDINKLIDQRLACSLITCADADLISLFTVMGVD